MNFYKRHIGDYLKDTAHLSLLEHGVYSRLLDVYYTREVGIPDAQAARLIGARGKDECAALKLVLSEFFELVDGTWIQDRCEREIEAASTKIEANRENGKKGGRPKKSQTEQKPTENPNGLATENPVGFDSLTQKNLSQTPDAISQTPDLKAEASTDAGGEPRATVRPADISAAMRRHSIEAQPGDPRIIAAAEAGITVETIEAACAEAKSSDPEGRIKPGFVLSIAQRWTADAAKPRPVANARGSPMNARDDRRARAFEVLTSQTVTQAAPEGDFIDVQAKQIR